MECKICAAQSDHFSIATIFQHEVGYFRCRQCGFIQTEEPYWLEEAYTEAITSSDIGLISRNIIYAKISQALIQSFFDPEASFVDYGGGYGALVRLMRDAGFDFYRYDKFCANLFAKGFEAKPAAPGQYELVTAFEVFEHLAHPLAEIKQMLRFSRNILFSTLLVPSPTPRPGEWWYYGLEHGQHLSLYTPQSLTLIAEKFGLKLYSNGVSLHLLTDKKIVAPLFQLISRYKVAILLNALRPKRSLLADDYFKLTGRPID
ncbi:MAG: class I SAM-dependent methyltransferase [Chloroflexota bacterium]